MIQKQLLLLCFLFFIIYNSFGQNIVVKPYLQDVEPTSLYIMWETDGSGLGFVDWGTSPFNLTQTTTSTQNSGSGGSQIHTVFINGLSADTKYFYQIRTSTNQLSFVYNFKTIPTKNSEASIRLLAMSDMQRDGSQPNKFEEIVEQGSIPVLQLDGILDLSEQVDAFLIPGDLVPTGGVYSDWENYFFSQSDSLTPYTPIYPVLGNHEYFIGGETNFKKYFQLPTNGTAGKEDEWWFKDLSNTRLIGMNSNSGGTDQDTQLTWLQNILNTTCGDADIDFVFVELHHPHKSELWVPGELDFTGEVIEKLETFTTNCGKPSIHFFGHTHGYSRGQSRDHNHLWVNVATAGGSIDYWGEFENADYEEFTKSQDEYGFVILDVEAGVDPNFTLKRYSRGDANITLDNVLRDEITIKRYDDLPYQPIPLFPKNEIVNPACLTLKSNHFYDVDNNIHQASHWQIALNNTTFENSLVYDSWKQSENWYNEINTQANDDLTDELVNTNLLDNQTYFWRVRHRDEHLNWSSWSDIQTFTTGVNTSTNLTANLLMNNGAENDLLAWNGQIEALTSLECGSVVVYNGSKMFAVGGVCDNESTYGSAYQDIDVSPYNMDIDNGGIFLEYGGYLRNYSGDDIPSLKAEFFNATLNSLGLSPSISNTTNSWTLVQNQMEIPTGTRTIRLILEAQRNNGTDNDCYFDELSLVLLQGTTCSKYNPCPVSATLNEMISSGALTVQVQDEILSTSILNGTSILSYQAGNSITLDAGFCSDLGVEFEAIINGCTP